MRPWESVANRPLPCMSYRSFKLFKISASDFGTLGTRFRAYEFLPMATKGVVHGVHKVVIRSIRWVKVLVVLPHLCLTATKGELRLMKVASMWPTLLVLSSYCYWQLKNHVNSGRQPVVWKTWRKWGDLRAVTPSRKTSNHGMYRL